MSKTVEYVDECGFGDASTPFDWPKVFADLDGERCEESLANERAAAAMAAMLVWICQPGLEPPDPAHRHTAAQGIGSRALAALHTLNPGAFQGTPSQAQLCRRFGRSHGWLTSAASEFSSKFGVVNHGQSHGRNGQHARKLRVDFKPVVHFEAPIQIISKKGKI